MGSGSALTEASLLLIRLLGPVDSITDRLATACEDRECPQGRVLSEDLNPVVMRSYVEFTVIWLSIVLEIFNSGLAFESKLHMELEEHGHQDSDDPVEHVGNLNDQVVLE